jgi:membrane protein DedA with SNARE-associated domain
MPLSPKLAPEGPDVVLDGDAQRVARLAGSTLAVLGLCSMLGVSSWLYLVNHYPLLLIALSPIGRHLILVAPITDPWAFVAVAVVRRMAFYLGSFYLGRALGPPGVLWIEARARHFGRFVRWLERIFQRWGRVVVFAGAGPTVSALAGISGMGVRSFAALAVPGLILRMLLILAVAEWLEEPIRVVLDWIDRHWVEGTAVMVLGVLVYQLVKLRRAPSGPEPPG